jgi:hypothetical protein
MASLIARLALIDEFHGGCTTPLGTASMCLLASACSKIEHTAGGRGCQVRATLAPSDGLSRVAYTDRAAPSAKASRPFVLSYLQPSEARDACTRCALSPIACSSWAVAFANCQVGTAFPYCSIGACAESAFARYGSSSCRESPS